MPASQGRKDRIMDQPSLFTQNRRVLEQSYNALTCAVDGFARRDALWRQLISSWFFVCGFRSWRHVDDCVFNLNGFCNLTAPRFAQLSQVTDQSHSPDTSSTGSFTPTPRPANTCHLLGTSTHAIPVSSHSGLKRPPTHTFRRW